MSEYATIEHCVNHVMDEITKRDVEQVSERLRALGWEEVVRCRDCRHFKPGEEEPPVDWCCYFHDEVTPLGFCAWGTKTEFVTCKCGEDIERIDRIQTCPSCGRRVMA